MRLKSASNELGVYKLFDEMTARGGGDDHEEDEFRLSWDSNLSRNPYLNEYASTEALSWMDWPTNTPAKFFFLSLRWILVPAVSNFKQSKIIFYLVITPRVILQMNLVKHIYA